MENHVTCTRDNVSLSTVSLKCVLLSTLVGSVFSFTSALLEECAATATCTSEWFPRDLILLSQLDPLVPVY